MSLSCWREYTGALSVHPPLNPAETEYLHRFARSRRMAYPEGPYHAPDTGVMWLPDGKHNEPPDGQPGLYCCVHPGPDIGTLVCADGDHDHAAAWIQYLISHFLAPNGSARDKPGFEEFTFDHVINGEITENSCCARKVILVKNNKVTEHLSEGKEKW